MSLILLNSKIFVPSPGNKLAFPCLKVTESGGNKKFRFALLVSDENKLAQKLLLSLGLKKQNLSLIHI